MRYPPQTSIALGGDDLATEVFLNPRRIAGDEYGAIWCRRQFSSARLLHSFSIIEHRDGRRDDSTLDGSDPTRRTPSIPIHRHDHAAGDRFSPAR
jgi:hypothetical protein